MDKVRNREHLILHFYGFPGSGKSQLVRLLAQKFPYSNANTVNDTPSSSTTTQQRLPVNDPVCIKWHVQCKDTGDNLKEEFLKLAEELQNNSYAESAICFKSLREEFRKDQANIFVQILVNCHAPVLIIVEDPTDVKNEIPILRNFFESLNQHFQTASPSKFHVYVTSRSRTSVLTESMSLALQCHQIFNINGFTEDEAVYFLQRENVSETDTREILVKVFERFSGLPLGLLAAKGYCQQTGLEYGEYLELVDDVEYDIISQEKEATLEEYGQNVEHVFQAIVMPFIPDSDCGQGFTNPILHWKILCCISYFHYDRIPRFLLEHCCHIIRESEVKNPGLRNKADVGILTKKLLKHNMCTAALGGAFSFHEVVLNAFRLKQQSVQGFNPLKKAMETICGLLSLDLRRKENSARMQELRPHLQTLLHHIEKNSKILEKDEDFELLKSVTSHLYQVQAAVSVSEWSSEASNKMYQKAFETIWPEMCPVFHKETFLLQKESPQEIVKNSSSKAKHLPKDFFNKYSSWIKLSHFDEDEVAFLKSESKGQFEEVKNLLGPLDSKTLLVKKLQECGLFLSELEYGPIFFAERFASIMHGWSRHFLFSECNKSKEICLEMNRLSKEVSVCVRTLSRIPLLTEWLSQIGGLVPILLKQKNNPENLQKAWHLCQEMIKNEKLIMYENGLVNKAFNPPSLTKISLLRYIVRINTRLIRSVTDQNVLKEADDQCKQLLHLTANSANSSNGISFIIYCAKYYAARRNFPSALFWFKKFFHLSSSPNLKPKFYIECWAVYNYARAVNCAKSYHDKAETMQRIKNVLDSNEIIQDDLKQHLQEELHKLEGLVF